MERNKKKSPQINPKLFKRSVKSSDQSLVSCSGWAAVGRRGTGLAARGKEALKGLYGVWELSAQHFVFFGGVVWWCFGLFWSRDLAFPRARAIPPKLGSVEEPGTPQPRS